MTYKSLFIWCYQAVFDCSFRHLFFTHLRGQNVLLCTLWNNNYLTIIFLSAIMKFIMHHFPGVKTQNVHCKCFKKSNKALFLVNVFSQGDMTLLWHNPKTPFVSSVKAIKYALISLNCCYHFVIACRSLGRYQWETFSHYIAIQCDKRCWS